MPVRIENITVPEEAVNWDASQFVRFTETESDRPDLVSAKVVVAGGRGLIDEAGFSSLESWPIKLVLPLEQPVLPSIWDFVPMIGR